jgi:type I restriction enzyme S subunit
MTSVPTLTNQQINTIICDPEKANPKFVYYSMRLHRDELTAKAAGAATPIINKSTFEEIEVALPDLEIQHWIANIISNYDDLIEVNTRRITILEEMTCRLFDEWFVKYQFPDHGAATFVETDEGRIPQGWTKTDVRTLIERKKAGLTATCVLPATYCFPS